MFFFSIKRSIEEYLKPVIDILQKTIYWFTIVSYFNSYQVTSTLVWTSPDGDAPCRIYYDHLSFQRFMEIQQASGKIHPLSATSSQHCE